MSKGTKNNIYTLVKENPGINSVEICSKFKSSTSIIIMGTIGILIKEGKIERYAIAGIKNGYRVIINSEE